MYHCPLKVTLMTYSCLKTLPSHYGREKTLALIVRLKKIKQLITQAYTTRLNEHLRKTAHYI